MEKELGADVIKLTQASLGKYVKRPPLSEKLLRKPPFRFLHDIVSSVHKTTGFFDGLFEADELISENVKDRDSKILFLNKVISVIGLTTGKSLAVKSSKIVAGQEPDKTNELLQCLALALDKKLSSDEAVKKYKESTNSKAQLTSDAVKQTESTKKTVETKKLKSKGNEKLTTYKKEHGTVNKSDTNKNSESKTKKLENIVPKNVTQTKKSEHLKNKNTAVTNKTEPLTKSIENQDVTEEEVKKNKADYTSINKNTVQLNLSSETEGTNIKDGQLKTSTSKDVIIQNTDQDFNSKLNSSYTIGENELNSSLSSQDLMEVENTGQLTETNVENITNDTRYQAHVNHKQDSISEKDNKLLPLKITESALARDDNTDLTDKSNEFERSKSIENVVNISSIRKKTGDIRPPSVRPPSSRPGAPRPREKIDNVIADNDSLLLAKVNIIAENTNIEDEEDSNIIVLEQHTIDESTLDEQLQLSSNEHGHLVQQILDSQKEFSQVGKTEIEWQFGAQKVKDAANQEIEQLRFNIQALSRVANPLGKLLDHIQEDAEVMRQELQQWTNVYDEVSKEMHKQKTANDETLVPLQTRLKQLDIDIQEKRDKIDDLKILIHKNASRIEKLLINGNVQ